MGTTTENAPEKPAEPRRESNPSVEGAAASRLQEQVDSLRRGEQDSSRCGRNDNFNCSGQQKRDSSGRETASEYLPQLALIDSGNKGRVDGNGAPIKGMDDRKTGDKGDQSNKSKQGNIPALEISTPGEQTKEVKHLSEQQEKNGQVQRGEGPYQVAGRLLGKGASHDEKMSLAMAMKEQYKQETNNRDPQMRGLSVGHSLMNEGNYEQILARIGDKSMQNKIGERLNPGHGADSRPEQRPGQNPEQKPEPGTEKPRPVEVDRPDFRRHGGPAAIRYNNPGAMWPGESSRKFGATEHANIAGGNQIAIFKDAVSGAAAQFDLLSSGKYANMTVRDAVGKWSGHHNDSAYAAGVRRDGVNLNARVGDVMKDKDKAIVLAKAMSKIEAGRDYPLSKEQWSAAYDQYREVNGLGQPKDQRKDQPKDQPKEQPQEKPDEHQKDQPKEPEKLGPLGTKFVPADKPQPVTTTIASVYGDPQETSSGRPFNPKELTCAVKPELARQLGLRNGDVLRVTHEGKSVDVVYTDAGPFVNGRGIDLSTEAGRRIGITEEGKGVGKVSFQKIGREPGFMEAPHGKRRK